MPTLLPTGVPDHTPLTTAKLRSHLPCPVEQHECHWRDQRTQQLTNQLSSKHGTWRSQADVACPEVTHQRCSAAGGVYDNTADAQTHNNTIALQKQPADMAEEQ
jgi:hypothetical protein